MADERSAVSDTTELGIDEIYLRVWEKQQEWTGTRWAVTTFFLGISFAIFGLSFQGAGSSIASDLQRVAGLVLYWFTYVLFRRYNDWSKFLRAYLEELEAETSTRLNLQARWKSSMQTGSRRWMSVTKLLLYFGILYAVAVLVLWVMGI